MQKLNPKTIKLHVKIITPIHIDNGEVLDRMDYFILGDEWRNIQVMNKKWLVDLGKNDLDKLKEFTNCISKGEFKKLEEIKSDFYSEEIGKHIIEEIKVGEKAKKSLLNTGNSSNQGFIKRFSRFGIDKELFIPGSTLKGIFRTISLFSKVNEINGYEKEKKEKYLENLDNGEAFDNTFSFLLFEDVNITNLVENLEIQEINSKNKPPREGQPPKRGISQILEVIKFGEFDFSINDLNSKIEPEKLINMLDKYSKSMISREERILNNIGFRSDLIKNLKLELNNGYFPIKIGMFKKSLSYKLFWEEMINELNINFSGKDWLKEAQRKGIGDKMIYLDEQQNPVGWIAIKILDN